MVRGDPVVIFGDGEQTRDFVYVDDIARAHDMALLEPTAFTVNISSGVPIPINELFSNASGNIQFIELVEANGTAGETGVNGHFITSNANSFLIPGPP